MKLLYNLLILDYYFFYPYFDIISEQHSNFLFIIYVVFPFFLLFLPSIFNKILSLRKSLTNLYCFLIISIFLIIAYSVGYSYQHYFENFTYEKWNNSEYCDMRYRMIDSLEKKYSFIGMSKKEVYSILENVKDHICTYDYEDTNQICYATYEAIMRNDFYCLYLNENGIVMKTDYRSVR